MLDTDNLEKVAESPEQSPPGLGPIQRDDRALPFTRAPTQRPLSSLANLHFEEPDA